MDVIPIHSLMEVSEVWEQIRAAGPQEGSGGFDPFLTDNVLLAEREGMQYERRKSFVAEYGWAIPTLDAIGQIVCAAGARQLLEVCAGTGLWASLLSAYGVDVTATDLSPPITAHFPVSMMDAREAVLSHPECSALLVVWPPMKSDCAYRALEAFTGDLFFYAGDARFTGDRQLQDALADSWVLEIEKRLPSWPGTSDALRTFRRC